MADSDPTEFMTTREAAALADNLASYGGKHSAAARVVTMERRCRRASRLIRVMLTRAKPKDVFELPAEG